MAVVPRKRKGGVVFYVVNEWQGKPTWEKVGTQKRQAEQRDNAMKREIRAGAYVPPAASKALTVQQYATVWCSKRTNASAKEELRTLKIHVFKRPWLASMRLDAVRHADVDKWVEEMRDEKKPDGSRRITDKTISNAVGVLKQVYQSAIRAELAIKNPCKLERGALKTAPAQEREIYTPAELLVLVRHHAIPWPIRMLNGLCLFTGMRKGEACARRWKDLDTSCGPLAALKIHDQYDGKPLKTDRPRVAPIHPLLAEMLEGWAAEGFELWTGRKPTPDDLIVPNVEHGVVKTFTRSTALKAFIRYAELASVRPRTMHATRHTFISLCRRGNAPKDRIEKITHNARGGIIDRYTHHDWKPLCDAVLCLVLDAHQEQQLPPGNTGNSGGGKLLVGHDESAGISANAAEVTGLYARTTIETTAENKLVQKTRQEKRQLTGDDLRAAARIRKRKLLLTQAADPDAARPGLEVISSYEAVLDGNMPTAVRGLAKAVRALGLGDRDGTYTLGENGKREAADV
jgi:integrase